ncbi:MAG TPA: Sec-independent protein translocase protein TatB [Sphingomonas sp.]|jgi:sec-independent protein translocase protein TatB
MFDVGWSEFVLVAVVALVVIGPKDLPKAMRVLGYWVGRVRSVGRQFRAGFDDMVREAELAEMEKRWAAENARIMAEHGAVLSGTPAVTPSPSPSYDTAATDASDRLPPIPHDHDALPLAEPAMEPIRVEKPEIRPAPGEAAAPRGDGVTS